MLPLTEFDQQFLLRLARRVLQEKIQLQHTLPDEGGIPAPLERPGGAFVTLHQAGSLRGCIGRIEASWPLHRTVRACALSAALDDPRFEPVRPEEVAQLQIEISALSSLFDVQPEEIQVGLHGLCVSQGVRRGLLLPQVAVKWEWDPVRFLEATCIKAGFPPGAWRQGARIQAFTAQVFAEKEISEKIQEAGGRS